MCIESINFYAKYIIPSIILNRFFEHLKREMSARGKNRSCFQCSKAHFFSSVNAIIFDFLEKCFAPKWYPLIQFSALYVTAFPKLCSFSCFSINVENCSSVVVALSYSITYTGFLTHWKTGIMVIWNSYYGKRRKGCVKSCTSNSLSTVLDWDWFRGCYWRSKILFPFFNLELKFLYHVN